jgi:hypothetical protein
MTAETFRMLSCYHYATDAAAALDRDAPVPRWCRRAGLAYLAYAFMPADPEDGVACMMVLDGGSFDA